MSRIPWNAIALLAPGLSVLGLLLPGCRKDETVMTRPAGDTERPVVSIVSPLQGETCQGVDTVIVSATDNTGVTGVVMYIDNQDSASTTSAPWQFSWDTRQFPEGPHSLFARAHDAAGNVGTSGAITVTVQNGSSVMALSSAISYTSSTLPGLFSFNQQDVYWSVTGLRPPPGVDYDLQLYDDPSYSSQLASSVRGAGEVDFIVGDHNHSREGMHYPKAVRYGGSGSYTIEWESGQDALTIPGTTNAIFWGSTTVVKVWDVSMAVGTHCTFTLNMVSGTADMGIALFRSDGSPYYAGRTAAAASADSHGSGQGETLSYTAPATDWYGVVVWSNNAAGASFTIQTSL